MNGHDYEFTLPLTVQIGGKKSRFGIDLNTIISRNRWDYQKAKKQFTKEMAAQLSGFDMIKSPISVHYTYYKNANNSPDLDNFVGGGKKFFQDSMVNHGFIEDDNVNFIPRNTEDYGGLDRGNGRIVAKVTVLD